MGRVHHHHAPAGTSGSVGLVHHKRTEPKEKPTYKVVLEEIAGKKKLKTMVSVQHTMDDGVYQSAPNSLEAFPPGETSYRIYIHTSRRSTAYK